MPEQKLVDELFYSYICKKTVLHVNYRKKYTGISYL
jgi:hypothetical protein